MPIYEVESRVKTLFVDMTNVKNTKKSTFCPAALIKPAPVAKKAKGKGKAQTEQAQGSLDLGSEDFTVSLSLASAETSKSDKEKKSKFAFKIPIMSSTEDIQNVQLYRNRVPTDDEPMSKPKVNKFPRKVSMWFMR